MTIKPVKRLDLTALTVLIVISVFGLLAGCLTMAAGDF